MSGSITIRPYTDADYPVVQKNLVQAGMFDPVCDGRENLASLAKQKLGNAYVAEMDGKIAGSLMVTPLGIHVCAIWRFVVAEQYRAQGIGLKLLEKAETIAKKHDAKEVWLFADVSNDALVAYYQKRGYEHNPDHRYFGMWKTLDG